ncbi:MAG TPA: cell envelope integrity protein CreD [Chitinophaga sp.]|uniref:cell envelope integrity protein CreD n=1 Tax=Chitinophaga sp. TaxID=1869181 RepID=UPI002BDD4F00|nr:cell envelope integrity protein CreD [Chitinophaga sp.]HVI45413.1 cell envelope integrity protein CreD [Chitinophaga sp.]
MEPYNPRPASFFDRYAYAIKAMVILFLMMILLIPTVMISNIIGERQNYHQEAISEVTSRWSGEQNVTGPVLAIPYVTPGTTGDTFAYLLPEQLSINGELMPQTLKRGIFPVAVYDSKLKLTGRFSTEPLSKLNIPASAFRWDRAVMLIGITDLRGIGNQVQLTWNGQQSLFNPGVMNNDLFESGIQTPVSLQPRDTGIATGNFVLDIGLKGSGRIKFSPVGKTTSISIRSSWPDPSFDEAFPPQTRSVSEKGFSATWQVQHLNRNYPQSWSGSKFNIRSADVGIRLFMPGGTYQQSSRAIKYAILIIGLTFFIFYFMELSQRRAIHPLQYMLVGLALCIFYTLLISISEQLNFALAYVISSGLTIGLITMYVAGAYKSGRIAAAIGGSLVLLYGFIYVIISAEDQALLMGSLGLFIILAVIMYFSRTIKWNKLSDKASIAE